MIKFLIKIYKIINDTIFRKLHKIVERIKQSKKLTDNSNEAELRNNVMALRKGIYKFFFYHGFTLVKYSIIPLFILCFYIIYKIIKSNNAAEWTESIATFIAIAISLRIHSIKSKLGIYVNDNIKDHLSIELLNNSRSPAYAMLTGIFLSDKYSNYSNSKKFNLKKFFVKFFPEYSHPITINNSKIQSLVLKKNSKDKRLGEFVCDIEKNGYVIAPYNRFLLLTFKTSDHLVETYSNRNLIDLNKFVKHCYGPSRAMIRFYRHRKIK